MAAADHTTPGPRKRPKGPTIVGLTCRRCGKPFNVAKGKSHDRLYCSRQCGTPSLNTQPIPKACEVCGKSFPVRPSREARWPARFCSRPCLKVGRRTDILTRFWSRVRKTDDCWIWTGNTYETGYGQIASGPRGGKMIRAHRLSWEIHNGPIPAGLLVLHRCDNPPCVNPNHLFLGTCRDNSADMIAKGRARWQKVQAED